MELQEKSLDNSNQTMNRKQAGSIPTKKIPTRNKGQSFNEDIKNYIKQKKLKRNKIEISYLQNFAFKLCRCKVLDDQTYRFLNAIEEEYNKKTDIVLLLKNIDRLNCLNKILLNKNQNYMLKNKDLKVVGFSDKKHNSDDIEEIKKTEKEQKIIELYHYLKNKIEENKISDIDKFLFVQIDPELKELMEIEGLNII